jgi:hypothetical protein
MAGNKRERIEPGSSHRYARRDARGRFTKDQVDMGRASAADQRQHSSTPGRPGHGDRGDRPKDSPSG